MSNTQAALVEALDALELAKMNGGSGLTRGELQEIADAIASVRAAIAQAEAAQPEPYLYVYEYDSWMGLHREFYPHKYNGMEPTRTVPLYAAPQPAKTAPNLACKSVQKRLAEQWGYVPAEAAPKQEAVADERAAFEKWAKAHGRIFLNRRGEGYIHQFTMEAWVAWQARAALSAQPQQPAPEPVAPLSDGFEQWWKVYRVKRVLNPAGVARMVWEASARHNRAAAPQTPAPGAEGGDGA